eukprot:scaffold1245_cov252-Pinguiococcus_pyrenoidosus.AAC.2
MTDAELFCRFVLGGRTGAVSRVAPHSPRDAGPLPPWDPGPRARQLCQRAELQAGLPRPTASQL